VSAGGLPAGWAKAKLPLLIGAGGEFTDGDWVESKDQDPKGDVRLVQLADVGDGKYIDKSARFLTSKKAAELKCTYLREGDVLIARMPDPLGRACIFPGDLKPSVTVVDVCIVRSGATGVDHRWLMHAINAPATRSAIQRLASGTTRSRISRSNLAAVDLPIPPVNEQRRIVAKLEAVLARSRRAKEALDAIPDLLERFRKSVLTAAFRGDLTRDWRQKNPEVEPASVLLDRIRADRRCRWEQAELDRMRSKGKVPADGRWKERYEKAEETDVGALPKLPDDWTWAALGELVSDSFYGPRFSASEYTPDGIPTIRTTDMNSRGQIEFADPPRVNLRSDRLAEFGLQHDDLLVTRTGSIGRCALYDAALGPALPSAYLIRFRLVVPLVRANYVLQFLLSPMAQAFMGKGTTAVTQPNINARVIQSMPVPVAPAAEQDEIVRRVNSTLAVADRLEAMVREEVALLESLERTTLGKAFRGELVRQDPSDEPAAVLLQRLRKDREQAEGEGRGTTQVRRTARVA
jgi:type I restriction enzyme, S subunit